MKLTVELGSRSYDVTIEAGSLHTLGTLANLKRRVMVVTDTGVPKEYAQIVLEQADQGFLVCVPQGEVSKSLTGFETILKALMENGFTRQDCVVAVGGGVVGDLAGYAAASYMRGIDFINCPTTTLSQIDSSIGGKVAINLERTKNIVGAFHQPKAVVIDIDTIKTLSQRHVMNGLAEAVKAGFIADEGLLQIFEEEDIMSHLEEIIYRSLMMKKKIVEEDEMDKGIRAILNFGHTIGHAIEGLHLDEWHHGECVALGMLPMLQTEELRDRARAIYKKLNLSQEITDKAEDLYTLMLHDKKAEQDSITIVTVSKAGQADLKKIDYTELRQIIEQVAL